jgi:Phage integrase, N-terminal SAM-like domain
VESAKLRGAWTDPAAGRVTFASWLEEWWGSAADLRPSTRARDQAYFKSLVLPRFGGMPLAAIRQPDVQAWGGRAVGTGLQAGHGREGLPAPWPHDDGGGQRRHAAAFAVPAVRLPRVEREEMRFLTPARSPAWPT